MYWVAIPISITLLLLIHFIIVFLNADPNNLAFGLDFRTKPCGNDELKNRSYLYFIKPNIDLNLKMCVFDCPPGTNYDMCLYRPNGVNEHKETRFCYTSIQSRRVNKYCVPVEQKTRETVENHLNMFSNVLGRIIGDLFLGRDLIILGFFVSLIVTNIIAYFFKARMFVFVLTIINLITGPIVSLYITFAFYLEYTDWMNEHCGKRINKDICKGQNGRILFFMICFFLAISCLIVVYILLFITRIVNTIRLLLKTMKLFARTFQLKWINLAAHIIHIFLTIWMFALIMYGYASGTIALAPVTNIDGGQVKVFKPYTVNRILLLIDIILIMILRNFITVFNKANAIYVCTDWYFTRKKKSANFAILRANLNIFKYHIGTIAKIAFFDSIFSPQKMVIGYIYRFLKNLNQESDTVRFFMSLSYPLILYYNNFLRYIDPLSFIQTVLWSNTFSKSYKSHFFLKNYRNNGYDFKVFKWMRFVILMNKMMIIGVMAILMHLFIFFFNWNLLGTMKYVDFKVNVIFFFIIFSWPLCNSFFDSYLQIVKTIIICYLIDTEMFVGDQLYVEHLQKMLDYVSTFSKRITRDRRYFGFRLFKEKTDDNDDKVFAADFFDSEEEEDLNDSKEENKSSDDDGDDGESISDSSEEEKENEKNLGL